MAVGNRWLVLLVIIFTALSWNNLSSLTTHPDKTLVDCGDESSFDWLKKLPDELVTKFKTEARLYTNNLEEQSPSEHPSNDVHTTNMQMLDSQREHSIVSNKNSEIVPSTQSESSISPAKLLPPSSESKRVDGKENKQLQTITRVNKKQLPRVLLFIIVRSKDTNTEIREAARRTWLSEKGLVSPSKAQYRFFIDKQNCCAEENSIEKDLVIASPEWLHSNFSNEYGANLGYKELAWGGEGFKSSNYARDWDVNLIRWATQHYDFKFIVSVDDDAYMCGAHLVYQLSLLPTSLSSFVLGHTRWDSFDNCFILITRDLADFFAEKYYSLLRPTHHASTHFNFKGAGSSFGGGWSKKVGDWPRVLKENGFNLVFRSGGIPRSCNYCAKHEMAAGQRVIDNRNSLSSANTDVKTAASSAVTPFSLPSGVQKAEYMDVESGIDSEILCYSDKNAYWESKCEEGASDGRHCRLPDCYPEKEHVCNAPLIDHRTFNNAWTKMSERPYFYFHNPADVCSNRFMFDKIKNTPDMDTWWKLTGELTSSPNYAGFHDRSHFLLYPNTKEKPLCKQVPRDEPGTVGPDVHPKKNFQNPW